MKSVTRAYEVFRDEGAAAVLDHTWIKLQLAMKAHKTEVHLDGCVFDLEGVPVDSTRVDLLTNRYEVEERSAVKQYLPRSVPVVELGGSMGVVACVTNKLLSTPTAHVVVEANPFVLPHLRRSKELNHGGFTIVNKAIAYGTEAIVFRPAADFFGSSVTRSGELDPVTVETITLGALVRERGFETFTLVCDIEGQEYEMILNEPEVLAKAGLIIMETHARFIGEDKLRQMMEALREIGFRLVQESGFVVVLQR